MFVDQALQVLLVENRNTGRIKRSGEFGGITPAGDAGNLRGRKADHVVFCVSAKDDVEIMEVSACRTENQNFFRLHGSAFLASFKVSRFQSFKVSPSTVVQSTTLKP